MVFNRNRILGLGGLVLTGVAVTVLVNSAFAQGGATVRQGGGGFQGGAGGQGGGFGQGGAGGGFGQPGQPGRGFQFQPMGMGGAPTMIGDEKNLFILQGNRLIKVKKSDLSIEAEKQLPNPRPPQGGGAPGGPGGMPPLE